MSSSAADDPVNQAVVLLADALSRHESRASPHYDEVFHQVSARASAAGELGK